MKVMFWRIAIIVLLVLIDLYVFQAVKIVSSHRSAPVQKIIFYVFWAVTIFSASLLLISAFKDYHYWPKAFRQYALGIFVVMYFSKVFVIPFLLIDDIIRLFRWIASYLVGSKEMSLVPLKNAHSISRIEFLNYAGLILAAIPFSTLIFGIIYGKYSYKVRKIKVFSPKLPNNFEGLRMLQISDFHVGSFTDRGHVQKAIDLILAQNADVIFFTGDLVNDLSSETDEFMDILQQLKAPLGIYSILGNHDYGDYVEWQDAQSKINNLERLKNIERNLGWRLLLNENVSIEKNGQKISLAGVENWSAVGRFPKYGDLDKAMKGIDANDFTILLSHDPSHWSHEVILKYPDVDLTLSGHTHGMQFGVEIPGFRWRPVQYVYKQWAGLYTQNKQNLYVNRGLGFIGYPGRVGIMPEITVFELGKG